MQTNHLKNGGLKSKLFESKAHLNTEVQDHECTYRQVNTIYNLFVGQQEEYATSLGKV